MTDGADPDAETLPEDTDIRPLDETTVAKIAAGEVVERPASVVKELVENALDAEASRVDVAVENGGIDRIEVRDDGVGMTASDLRAAVREHTTSKLSDATELQRVQTLGFRGEALHTIGAVSRMTVTSRPRVDSESEPPGESAASATELRYAGGDVEAVEPAAHPEGTTVAVEDLFYNTPARRKYLAESRTEFRHVSKVVGRYALATPDVAVSLEHDGNAVFSTTGDGDRRSAVLAVYGREVAESMIEVETEPDADAVERVAGLVSDPEVTRTGRDYLATYVNGRYVEPDALRSAIVEAYGGQLAADRYPFAVLFVDVPPERVDVNVHPRKLAVRFDEEAAVRDAVTDAVRDALLDAGLVRSSAPRGVSAPDAVELEPSTLEASDDAADAADGEETAAPDDDADGVAETAGAAAETADTAADAAGTAADAAGTATDAATTETSQAGDSTDATTAAGSATEPAGSTESGTTAPGATASDATAPDASASDATAPDASASDATETDATESDATGSDATESDSRAPQPDADRRFEASSQRTLEGTSATPDVEFDRLPSLRVLGQHQDTYVVAESDDGLVLVDQHAADERVHFERLRAAVEDGTAQALAEPVELSLTPTEAATFDDCADAIERLGFHADRDGQTLRVRSVPTVLDEALAPETVRDVFEAMLEGGDGARTVEAMAEELLADLACAPAVTSNTSLTEGSVTDLLAALDDCENPFECPHGRPTVVRVDADELAERFERDYPGHGQRRP